VSPPPAGPAGQRRAPLRRRRPSSSWHASRYP
jgi:hypothetical protein